MYLVNFTQLMLPKMILGIRFNVICFLGTRKKFDLVKQWLHVANYLDCRISISV